jgi:hypothetical protein
MTGFFSDVVNFGGTNLISGGTVGGQFGSFDIFVAKFSSIGVHVSSEGYGGLLNNIGQGVAVDSSGVIAGTGSFKGSATFRDVSLTSAGLQDIYFFRLIDSVGIALGLNPVEHDITGYNSDMLYWGFTSTPTNWPTRILYTNNIGGFNYAAQFVNYTNHIPAYNNFTINQFGGITNISAFSNLTAITVCVWAKHADDVGETRNNVATFIDTCEGSPGPGVTWSLGRNSAYQTSFDIFTNQDYNTCCTMHLNFPDNDSTDWHFYVGTFSTTNQMMNIYLDGTNCDNRNFTGYCPWATNIMVGVPSSSGSYPGKNGWISIGCRTHVGSPQLDDGDQFPNNGWMDGQLADLRVYNRELSAGEVLAIYHGGGGTSIPVVVPPNTNGSPLIKATNLQIRNNGRIVIGH